MTKILDTMHAKKRYWLVFDEMEIVGKFETEKEAIKFRNGYKRVNK
jgi:hypothetical protein